MTPSGFNIGTNLKTKVSLNFTATGSSEIMNLIIPYMIKELLVSPGWTLAVAMIALRSAISASVELKFVMMSISTELPLKLLVNSVFQTNSYFDFVIFSVKKFFRSE